jgi:hypothetical protein
LDVDVQRSLVSWQAILCCPAIGERPTAVDSSESNGADARIAVLQHVAMAAKQLQWPKEVDNRFSLPLRCIMIQEHTLVRH